MAHSHQGCGRAPHQGCGRRCTLRLCGRGRSCACAIVPTLMLWTSSVISWVRSHQRWQRHQHQHQHHQYLCPRQRLFRLRRCATRMTNRVCSPMLNRRSRWSRLQRLRSQLRWIQHLSRCCTARCPRSFFALPATSFTCASFHAAAWHLEGQRLGGIPPQAWRCSLQPLCSARAGSGPPCLRGSLVTAARRRARARISVRALLRSA